MKTINKIFLITVIAALSHHAVHAGNFVKIKSVDSRNSYPSIVVNISAGGPDFSALTGLSEENIQIFEDGYLVNYFKVIPLDETFTVQSVIVFDSSRSISSSDFSLMKKAVNSFLQCCGSNVNAALIRFNGKKHILSGFTEKHSEIMDGINTIHPEGKMTLLFDTLYDAVKLLQSDAGHKKTIFLVTDGKDEGSSIKPDDIIQSAVNSGVRIYTLIIGRPHSARETVRISSLSGGKSVYLSEPEEMTAFFRHISSPSHKKYRLEYKTDITSENNKHTLEVRLKKNTLMDRDFSEFTISSRSASLKRFLESRFLFPAMAVVFVLIVLMIILRIVKSVKSHRKTKNDKDKFIFQRSREDSFKDNGIVNNPEISPCAQAETTPVTPDEIKTESQYIKAWLIARDSDSGQKYIIQSDETTMGSSRDNDIPLDDDYVSEYHSKIKRVNTVFFLFDLVSENGTFLNGKKLLRPKQLHDWDEIQMGKSFLIFRGSNLS